MNTVAIKGLGWRQRHMLAFVNKHGQDGRRFHIANSRDERRVAESLQRHGLIKIIDKAYSCWMIRKSTDNEFLTALFA